jgi:hypothetical protein
MNDTLDKAQFWDTFKARAVVVTDLPPGHSRDVANQVNEAEGRGDASLRTKAEYSSLFGALLREPGSVAAPDTLRLRDAGGSQTAAGGMVEDYLAASIDKAEFFGEDMYVIRVTGWPADAFTPEQPVESSGDARLELWRTDRSDERRVPLPDRQGVLLSTATFSLMNSGNRTLRAPKRSWKVDFIVRDSRERLVDMSRLNLKAMFNDPSQMREALAWRLFATAGVPASQHTYARFAIKESYMGLFFFVEQVDERFLKDHFGSNDRGKPVQGVLRRRGLRDARASSRRRRGRQRAPVLHRERRRPELPPQDQRGRRTPEHLRRSCAARQDDRRSRPGGGDGRFGSDAFRASLEGIMNVQAFLRWAGVNLLVGSWDNYFATPANYYLYNAGHRGAEDQFMDSPYFLFIPWDYDNSFGIDYFGTQWQYTDIVDWPPQHDELLG